MRATEPTKKQKEKIEKHKLKATNWLVLEEKGIKLMVKHKTTGTERTLIG